MPLVGQYASMVRARVDEVAQETRYSDDFERLQGTMESIDTQLQLQNELLQQVLQSENNAD